jgi:hypothetical protein
MRRSSGLPRDGSHHVCLCQKAAEFGGVERYDETATWKETSGYLGVSPLSLSGEER